MPRTKQNPLGIAVGDTVRIKFNYAGARDAFLAEVTEVVDRVLMGQDTCIDYKPEESGRNFNAERLGIPYGCSVSHVVEVVRRGKFKPAPPTNIFREHREKLGCRGCIKRGGIRVALHDLSALISFALASATDTLDRPINIDRFFTRWEKDQFRGKVAIPAALKLDSDWFSPTAVHWKTFRKYVLANRHSILFTRREMEAMGQEHNRKMTESLWEDMDYEFGRDEWAAEEAEYS